MRVTSHKEPNVVVIKDRERFLQIFNSVPNRHVAVSDKSSDGFSVMFWRGDTGIIHYVYNVESDDKALKRKILDLFEEGVENGKETQ